MHKKPEGQGADPASATRKPYGKPKLTRYGAVHSLTRAGTSTKNEGNPTQKRIQGSDRRLKQRIERVGTHPLGIGLYLFDYRASFRDAYGHGRRLGVMADEVLGVRPSAVSRDAAGYFNVDYAALGIETRSGTE